MTQDKPKPSDSKPGDAKLPAEATVKSKRGSRTALWVLAMSFVMGVVAVLGALYLDQSFEKKIDRINIRADEMRREIQDGLRPNLRSVTERQDGLSLSTAAMAERVATMDEKLNEAITAQGLLSSMIQGGRRSWILYEVEYLLLNANDRLLLEADVGGAMRALEAARERLGVAADPQLLAVRARITQELAALRAVPQPDIEAIALTLSTLSASAPGMPLRARVPANFSAKNGKEATRADAPDRWQRFLQMASRALQGLAVIRRENRPIEPLLPPDQSFFLYQNLQLKLESARLSALQRNTQGFRTSVAGARLWLQEFFAEGDPQVKAAIKELAALEREELNWTLPNVTGSLNLLRQEMEARGVKSTNAEPVAPKPAKAEPAAAEPTP